MSFTAVKRSGKQSYQQRAVNQQSPGFNSYTLYQAFADEFEQYYMSFTGCVFPVHGVCFTFYEDFVERQMHNFTVARPFQRHMLTTESFLGFLHQLFEIAKNKVDPNWKPTAVLKCGRNWTEGCPKHLLGLRNEIKSVEYSSFAQQKGFAQVSDENSLLFQVFEKEFEQYYMSFSGFVFPVHGVSFTFYEDFIDCQMHNSVVTKPFQRHILTRENFLRFLNQLFEIAKSKVDPNWKPTAVFASGRNWTEGSPQHLQRLRGVQDSYDAKIIVEESKERQTNVQSELTHKERAQCNNGVSDIKSVGTSAKTKQQPSSVNQQQETGLTQLSNIQPSEENLYLFLIFFKEFEQYYMTFSGSLFPLHGVYFTFYEDFVHYQIHNFVLTRPLQRYLLTRDNFLRFLHQLFEIAKSKVDPNWKPTAVLRCGQNWTEGSPRYLQSLRNVPYMEPQTNMESISLVNRQQENGFAPLSNIQLSGENLKLYQGFEEEFEQYYMAFSGFVFPVHGVRFTFYEDFVDRQFHNFTVTKPLQRHVLTRESFLRFLHQLFEVAKNKVDPNWKPTAVVNCGQDWIEGSPKYLQSLRNVPYSYDARIAQVEENNEPQTNVARTDSETAIYIDKVSERNSSLESKSIKSSKSQGQPLRLNQPQENGLAQLSESKFNNEDFALFHVFEKEFKQYHVEFTGCPLPFSGVHFTFYKDFAERQFHNLILAMPLQRHILTQGIFQEFLHQLFEVAKNKVDPSWKPTAVSSYGQDHWTEGCPKHLQSLGKNSYNARSVVEDSKERETEINLTDNENAVVSNETFDNTCPIDLDMKKIETLPIEEHPPALNKQQETDFGQLSNTQITDENFTLNNVLEQGFASPAHEVYFTLYERFIDRHLDNVVITTRFERHILTRERFLGFIHRLFKIVHIKVDRSWKPTVALSCRMNWIGRCPQYLQSLRKMFHSYNARSFVDESNEVQKVVELIGNEGEIANEENTFLEFVNFQRLSRKKQRSFAVECLSKGQLFNDQTLSQDCIPKTRCAHRLFFTTVKTPKLNIGKRLASHSYENALNIVLLKDWQLSVPSDVNIKKVALTESKLQPNAVKFKSSKVTRNEGEPTCLKMVQYVPIGCKKWDKCVEERNVCCEEDKSDSRKEEQNLTLEHSELPEGETKTDERSSKEITKPSDENIQVDEQTEGAESLNHGEQKDKENENETKGKEEGRAEKRIDEALKEKDCKLHVRKTDGDEESTGESESPGVVTSGEETEGVAESLMPIEPDLAKQVESAKERATPNPIIEESESEAEKTKAEDDDANGELGGTEKKRTGCKEETEIDNFDLQKEICTSVELKEAEGECKERAQISEDVGLLKEGMVPKPGNVQEKGCGTENKEYEVERAQPEKKSENQTGIQECTLNDVPADDLHHCEDVFAVNETGTSSADPQRGRKRWKFNRRSKTKTDSARQNMALDPMDTAISEGQKADESQPPTYQPRRSRRRKNIIMGWLCGKIVRALVKNKTLL